MKHLAAYLLLTLGGNESPSASDITTLLGTATIEADAAEIEKMLEAVKGKVSRHPVESLLMMNA
jgi:large subunit ribosomal protein LP2